MSAPFKSTAATRSETESGLPARPEVVVRGGTVLTLDPSIGDLSPGDVHISNGRIVTVAASIPPTSIASIDATGMIVMPGFIETHNHLWNTALRNLALENQTPDRSYFALTLGNGSLFRPEDIYSGVLLGAAEMLHSGITTVHSWAHNIRAPEYARSDLRALRQSGIRARFSYGMYEGGPPPDKPMEFADIQALRSDWDAYSNEGLITLGFASRSISVTGHGQVVPRVLRQDWEAARRLLLPITIHMSGPGRVTALDREGLLGPDVQLVHPVGWTGAELDIVAKSRAHVCLSPWSDMRELTGFDPILELAARNIVTSLSFDSAAISGNLDMFAQMHALLDTQFARTGSKAAVSPRHILELATLGGARDLDLEGQTGSLTPGKRADLILIRSTDLNMAPMADPVEAVVRCAQPANVDTVMVDGRILKRGGRLMAIDPAAVVHGATTSLQRFRKLATV